MGESESESERGEDGIERSVEWEDIISGRGKYCIGGELKWGKRMTGGG